MSKIFPLDEKVAFLIQQADSLLNPPHTPKHIKDIRGQITVRTRNLMGHGTHMYYFGHSNLPYMVVYPVGLDESTHRAFLALTYSPMKHGIRHGAPRPLWKLRVGLYAYSELDNPEPAATAILATKETNHDYTEYID
jgi:hypothetical protein